MNKIIVFTIFLLSFFCMFNMGFVEKVRADSETFRLVNWDNASVGASNFSTEYITVHRNIGGTTLHYVLGSNAINSSPNSYYIGKIAGSTSTVSFINYSIANTVSGIKIFFRYKSFNGGHTQDDYLYMYFTNSSGSQYAFYILFFMHYAPTAYSNVIYYGDGSTNTLLIGGATNGYSIKNCVLWVNRSTSGSNTVKLENFTTGADFYSSVLGSAMDLRFVKSIKCNNSLSAPVAADYLIAYLDDIYLSYDTTYEEPPSYGGDYLEQWDYIGSHDYQGHVKHVDDRVIETDYAININTTVKGVDLMVTPYQYETIGHVLTFYYMKLNGIEHSHPDYFFNLNGNFVLRWQFNQTIDNEQLVFEFLNMWKPIGSTYYWDVLTGGDLNSIDWDNDAEFRSDNNITYYDGYYNSRTVYDEDLIYMFYYEGIHIVNTSCEYGDYVVPDFINPEGASYPACVPLHLIYTVSETYPLTYFTVWNMSPVHRVYNKLITECSGTTNFVMSLAGSYCAVIQRLGVNVSNKFNFTLTPCGNNWIYCIPEPSYADGKFTMYYDYLAGEFEKGLILGGFERPLTYENAEYRHFINVSGVNHETGNTVLSYGHTSADFYLKMYKRIYDGSSYVYSEIESYTHKILATGGGIQNILFVNPKKFIINDGDYITFRAYGQRILIGTENIKILANGYVVYTLPKWGSPYPQGFSENITLNDRFYKDSHIINISLVIKNNVTQLLLDTQFITIEFKTPDQGNGLSTNENYLLGFIIIAVFLAIPLIVQLKSHSEINILVYMFFGFIGLMLDLVFGILPWFIPATIFVLMIFAIIIIWLSKKQG